MRRVLEAPFVLLCVMGIGHLVHLHLSRYPPLWNAVAARWFSVGVTAVDGWFIVAILCGLLVAGVFNRWPWAWAVVKPFMCGGAAVVWVACAMALIHPAGPLPQGQSAGPQVRPAREIGPGNPVVWIVLDEWDYDLTYRRKDRKAFPEFERLRKQAVFFDDVRAAGKITLVAIPGLLMGRTVRDYRAVNPSAARFVSVGTAGTFPGPPTIFDTASQFGYQSHIVGWYHPYCRIFGAQVASCWWDDLMLPPLRPGGSIAARAGAFLRDSIELEILPVAGPANNILKHMARINPMIEQASAAASQSGRSFSFLHLPVPHGPFFKLDAGGQMIPLPTDAEGYQSGLDAADRAIGSLRAAMERSGVWDEALVIVTSDHPYRYQYAGGYGNGHIPMMIKFPHQSAAVIYSHPFQAVETKNLIENFMQGTMTTPERAVVWLERNAPPAGVRTAEPVTSWTIP